MSSEELIDNGTNLELQLAMAVDVYYMVYLAAALTRRNHVLSEREISFFQLSAASFWRPTVLINLLLHVSATTRRGFQNSDDESVILALPDVYVLLVELVAVLVHATDALLLKA